MSKETKKAAIFLLKHRIRVMQSDYQFGKYSDEIKDMMHGRIEEAKNRLAVLEKEAI